MILDVARQKAFYQRYLKDEPSEVDQWPTVRYELRDSYYSGEEKTADAWPIPGTEYRTLQECLDSGGRLPKG